MSLPAIKVAVFDRLEAATGLFPIHFDNVGASPPAGDHLRPFVLPATTRTLGLVDLGQEVGIIQVSIYVQKGKGDIAAADEGLRVLNLFPRNTELTGVRIDAIGTISPPFYDGNWQITPVSIPYQNIC